MAPAVYSAAIRDKATALMTIKDRWAHGVRISDGVPFVTFTSQRDAQVMYFTRNDGQGGCTCPAARLSRSGQCCHQLAVSLAATEAKHQAVLAEWQADGWEPIPAAEQAACDAAQERFAAEAVKPRKSYRELHLEDEFETSCPLVDAF